MVVSLVDKRVELTGVMTAGSTVASTVVPLAGMRVVWWAAGMVETKAEKKADHLVAMMAEKKVVLLADQWEIELG